MGIAPQIYHDFSTGHIEEYLNGAPLSITDSEEMFFHVAHALAQLHAVPLSLVPTVRVWDPWTELDKRIENLRDVAITSSGTIVNGSIVDGSAPSVANNFFLDEAAAEIESLHSLLQPRHFGLQTCITVGTEARV